MFFPNYYVYFHNIIKLCSKKIQEQVVKNR